MKKLNVQQMENVNGGCGSHIFAGAGIAIGIAGIVAAGPVLMGAGLVGLGAATASLVLGSASISVSVVERVVNCL